MFLKWDYTNLYSNERKKSNYFLPITLSYLYVQAILIVILAA